MTDASLKAKVTADIADFLAGMNRSQNAVDDLADGAGVSGKRMSIAFIAAAAAVTALTVAAGKQAEEFSQLSAITGIGTQALQRYDVLLNRVGLSGQDLTVMLRTLSSKVEDAKTGTGAAADRFQQLGIDITKVTSTDDLIRKIADSVSRFANGTEKAAIMGDLLGRSGLKFIPAFEGGSKAIDAVTEASARLGAELSGTQLAALGRTDDAFDDLTLATKRLNQQLGTVFAPTVDAAARLLTWLASVGSRALKSIDTAADTLALRFTHLVLAFDELASTVFSAEVFSGEAWKRTLDNIQLIDAEVTRLIEKRRALDELPDAPEQRLPAPALIDTTKLAKQARDAADAALEFSERLFSNQEALAQANLDNFQAHLASKKALATAFEPEIAQAAADATEKMSAFTVASLETQIRNYSRFYQQKSARFKSDSDSQAEHAQFELKSSAKIIEMLNQLEVAQVKSDTARIQSSTRAAQAVRQAQIDALEDVSNRFRALQAHQDQLFASERNLFGAAEAARRVSFTRIRAEEDHKRQAILNTFGTTERAQQKLVDLEEESMAQRRGVIRQYPTFWEQQLQSVVESNTFSVGHIVSTWTGGLARAVVENKSAGEIIKAAWQSTQIAIVQAGLNTLVQWGAQLALSAARELALNAALQAGKTAQVVAATATQTGAVLTGSVVSSGAVVTAAGTMAAANTTAATVAAASWSGAASIILGWFGTIAGGFAALALGLVATVTAVGAFVMGVLTAIAEALADTIFGIPVALLILAGVAAIAGALAATGNIPGLAQGGIVTGPTLALLGEAGPEAVVPLDRGVAAQSGPVTIIVQLDGAPILKHVANRLPSMLRLKGLPA